MGVLGTNTLARGITDTGIAVGAAVALGWGAYRVRAGEMDLGALLIILMLGGEGFAPAPTRGCGASLRRRQSSIFSMPSRRLPIAASACSTMLVSSPPWRS